MILSKPKLLFWSLLPILISLVLYAFVIGHLQTEARLALENYFAAMGWNPQGWTAWILLLVAKLLLFVAGALTFSIVASIAASPFNDFLAEQSEKWTTPPLLPAPAGSWAFKARLIAVDMMKTLFAAIGGIFALLLSWVPIVNLIAFGLAFLLICFQYVSYAQTRRSVGVAQGLVFLWRHMFACMGFGLAFSFLFAIPVISCLFIPVAVVGGTLLVARAPGNAELPRLR